MRGQNPEGATLSRVPLAPVTRLLLCLAVTLLASSAFAQQGTIAGTVVDPTGSAVAHVRIRLTLADRAPAQDAQSSESGRFSFSNVAPGPFLLSFTAEGFSTRTVPGELHAGENLELPPIALALGILTAAVNVSPATQVEVAQEQIKAEEHQRLIGIFPNFLANYDRDAAPLIARQKLELTARTWLDPSAFAINGIIAAVWQAQNTHKGFGQGAQGYAKRYGASFADYGVSLLLANVAAPTVFRQDPRYFYKGAGSTRSRVFYAISRTMVCRGDNKIDQFCYSSFVARFGSGFVTNYFYPSADRDKASTILRNSAYGIGFDALGNLFQEFVARKLTRKH